MTFTCTMLYKSNYSLICSIEEKTNGSLLDRIFFTGNLTMNHIGTFYNFHSVKVFETSITKLSMLSNFLSQKSFLSYVLKLQNYFIATFKSAIIWSSASLIYSILVCLFVFLSHIFRHLVKLFPFILLVCPCLFSVLEFPYKNFIFRLLFVLRLHFIVKLPGYTYNFVKHRVYNYNIIKCYAFIYLRDI